MLYINLYKNQNKQDKSPILFEYYTHTLDESLVKIKGRNEGKEIKKK